MLVIPGLIFLVRYSLVEPVVVLEGIGGSKSLMRSNELTKSKRWKIFKTGLVFLIAFFSIVIVMNLPLFIMEESGLKQFDIPLAILMDCIADIIGALITIILFLFYWESKDKTFDKSKTSTILLFGSGE